MKKLLYISFVFVLTGCPKDVDELSKLPRQTQEGAGTFGMLVNGKSWQPYSFMPTIINRKPLYISYSLRDKFVRVQTRNEQSKEWFLFAVTDISGIGSYTINSKLYFSTSDSAYADCNNTTRFEEDYNCLLSYKFNKLLSSSVNITRLDTIQKIVSGTFEVELISDNNQKLQITNGRFDSHFR